VLKQAGVGVPVVEVIRKSAISEQAFYRWKAKYVGLEVDQVRQMKQLQEENPRLKQLVAELSLEKAKRLIESCRQEYNESRPRRFLGERTPSKFASQSSRDLAETQTS
jgi:putative transposase